MSNAEQKNKVKGFIEFWKGKGYEKGQSQIFWLQLLSDVLGVEEPSKFIEFEDQEVLFLYSTVVLNQKIVSTLLNAFIGSLSSEEVQKKTSALSDKLNQQIGLENILYLTCPTCGEEINTFFRFGPEFFRPTNI